MEQNPSTKPVSESPETSHSFSQGMFSWEALNRGLILLRTKQELTQFTRWMKFHRTAFLSSVDTQPLTAPRATPPKSSTNSTDSDFTALLCYTHFSTSVVLSPSQPVVSTQQLRFWAKMHFNSLAFQTSCSFSLLLMQHERSSVFTRFVYSETLAGLLWKQNAAGMFFFSPSTAVLAPALSFPHRLGSDNPLWTQSRFRNNLQRHLEKKTKNNTTTVTLSHSIPAGQGSQSDAQAFPVPFQQLREALPLFGGSSWVCRNPCQHLVMSHRALQAPPIHCQKKKNHKK